MQPTPPEKQAEEKSSKDDAQLPAAGTLTPTTITETAGSRCSIPRALRDDFRSAVRSGLLLHLCPPSGQFAALFGVEESLRRGILGMLGAKDLATFGLVRAGRIVGTQTDYFDSLGGSEQAGLGSNVGVGKEGAVIVVMQSSHSFNDVERKFWCVYHTKCVLCAISHTAAILPC